MRRPFRILLVEDNPGDADLTREILEDNELPIDVTVVIDGIEALAYLLRKAPYQNADPPDLILLDLNLPKMDGRQVLCEIKKHKAHLRTPVVVLTSSDAEQDIVTSYELGANCYVTKRIGFEAFQTVLSSVGRFWFEVASLP